MFDCCGHCGQCGLKNQHTLECLICDVARIRVMREFAVIIRTNYYPAELEALHAHDLLLQGVYLAPIDRPR